VKEEALVHWGRGEGGGVVPKVRRKENVVLNIMLPAFRGGGGNLKIFSKFKKPWFNFLIFFFFSYQEF